MLPGLNRRWALPDDVPLVAATWTESARAAWRSQPECRIQFPQRVEATIREARARQAKAEKHRDLTAAAHERSLLNAIFSREFALLVQAHLLAIPPLVLFDEETPSLVIGWVHATPGVVNWVYVKHKYRRLGHATALLEAAGRPKEASMSTRAGWALWKSLDVHQEPHASV